MFYVGQKVVCVWDFTPHSQVWPECQFPVVGSVYTVRRVSPTDCGEGLWLSEIVNPKWSTKNAEPGFKVRAFRPVVERKTDISIFKAMLEPKRVGADA